MVVEPRSCIARVRVARIRGSPTNMVVGAAKLHRARARAAASTNMGRINFAVPERVLKPRDCTTLIRNKQTIEYVKKKNNNKLCHTDFGGVFFSKSGSI
jgi:hypothetical protein